MFIVPGACAVELAWFGFEEDEDDEDEGEGSNKARRVSPRLDSIE